MNLNNRVGIAAGGGLLLLGAALLSAAANASQSMIITVTKGFGVSLYATDVGDAKQMAVGDEGTCLSVLTRVARFTLWSIVTMMVGSISVI